jgi:hypothetical protein
MAEDAVDIVRSKGTLIGNRPKITTKQTIMSAAGQEVPKLPERTDEKYNFGPYGLEPLDANTGDQMYLTDMLTGDEGTLQFKYLQMLNNELKDKQPATMQELLAKTWGGKTEAEYLSAKQTYGTSGNSAAYSGYNFWIPEPYRSRMSIKPPEAKGKADKVFSKGTLQKTLLSKS